MSEDVPEEPPDLVADRLAYDDALADDEWLDRQATEALAEAAPANGHAPADDEPSLTPREKIVAALLRGEAICDIPPPEPLMGDILALDATAVLYGRGGGGKSLLALDWSMCVATGSWWKGHEIGTAGNVLYVIAEGVRGTGQRVGAWKEANHYAGTVPDGFVWLPMAIDLREPSWVGPLAIVAADLSPKLVVIDTLNRCMPGTDEGPADMGKIIGAAELVKRATGACVLIVHHSGKDPAQGARGHSSLFGAIDTELELKSAEGLLTMTVTKQKDGADGQVYPLAIAAFAESVAVVTRDRRTTDDRKITANGEVCIDTLARMAPPGGLPLGVWRDACIEEGVSKSGFYEQVKRLLDTGHISNLGSTARPAYVQAIGGSENPHDSEDF